MASDHQTQAGKPQPLNPKVGILLEGGAGNLYVLHSLCKVKFLLLVPSLYPVPQGTKSLRAAYLGPFPRAHPHPDVQHQLQTLNFSAYATAHRTSQDWGRDWVPIGEDSSSTPCCVTPRLMA